MEKRPEGAGREARGPWETGGAGVQVIMVVAQLRVEEGAGG